jgi:hypothetical protein
LRSRGWLNSRAEHGFCVRVSPSQLRALPFTFDINPANQHHAKIP